MSLSDLSCALARAEQSATAEELHDIGWMVSGFSAQHPVRRRAESFPRVQQYVRGQRTCRSEIVAITRVLTHLQEGGVRGAVAVALRAALLRAK